MAVQKITPRCNSRPRGYIENYRPNSTTRALLSGVLSVLEEYQAYWPLTVRQVFYRMVGAYGYDKSERAYKKLAHHMANARRARIIPFEAIRDDGVTRYPIEHFEDHDGFLRHVRELGKNYTRDKLASQDWHVEVWCEAAGMLPQLQRVASQYSIQCRSSGGFDSLTAKKDLADRLCGTWKPNAILHLGDYDPSGLSIFDSVAEDVEAFVLADQPHGFIKTKFERIALTFEQVKEFDLPTAPAKTSDSRARTWQGGTCQLEALPPNVIADILEAAILGFIDEDQLADDHEQQEHDRMLISGLLTPPSEARTDD